MYGSIIGLPGVTVVESVHPLRSVPTKSVSRTQNPYFSDSVTLTLCLRTRDALAMLNFGTLSRCWW